jgi:hypothetical protein
MALPQPTGTCANCLAEDIGDHYLCARCAKKYEVAQSFHEHAGAGAYDFGDDASPGVTIRMLKADRLVNADLEGAPGVHGFGPLWRSPVAASIATGTARSPRARISKPKRPQADSEAGRAFAEWCKSNQHRLAGAELNAVTSVYLQQRSIRKTSRRLSFCERRVTPRDVRILINRAFAKYLRATSTKEKRP